MLSVAHTITSLPIGMYLSNPLFIFVAAFLLHLFTDTLLHWNIYPYNFKRYPYELVALDIGSGIFISWLLLGNTLLTLPILIAIAGGNAPDVLHGLWDLLPEHRRQQSPRWVRNWFRFHDHLQLETTRPARGLIWQGVVVTIALTFLLFKG
jgi:hypothetical protein